MRAEVLFPCEPLPSKHQIIGHNKYGRIQALFMTSNFQDFWEVTPSCLVSDKYTAYIFRAAEIVMQKTAR
jgi:hypothetical protein